MLGLLGERADSLEITAFDFGAAGREIDLVGRHRLHEPDDLALRIPELPVQGLAERRYIGGERRSRYQRKSKQGNEGSHHSFGIPPSGRLTDAGKADQHHRFKVTTSETPIC